MFPQENKLQPGWVVSQFGDQTNPSEVEAQLSGRNGAGRISLSLGAGQNLMAALVSGDRVHGGVLPVGFEAPAVDIERVLQKLESVLPVDAFAQLLGRVLERLNAAAAKLDGSSPLSLPLAKVREVLQNAAPSEQFTTDLKQGRSEFEVALNTARSEMRTGTDNNLNWLLDELDQVEAAALAAQQRQEEEDTMARLHNEKITEIAARLANLPVELSGDFESLSQKIAVQAKAVSAAGTPKVIAEIKAPLKAAALALKDLKARVETALEVTEYADESKIIAAQQQARQTLDVKFKTVETELSTVVAAMRVKLTQVSAVTKPVPSAAPLTVPPVPAFETVELPVVSTVAVEVNYADEIRGLGLPYLRFQAGAEEPASAQALMDELFSNMPPRQKWQYGDDVYYVSDPQRTTGEANQFPFVVVWLKHKDSTDGQTKIFMNLYYLSRSDDLWRAASHRQGSWMGKGIGENGQTLPFSIGSEEGLQSRVAELYRSRQPSLETDARANADKAFLAVVPEAEELPALDQAATMYQRVMAPAAFKQITTTQPLTAAGMATAPRGPFAQKAAAPAVEKAVASVGIAAGFQLDMVNGELLSGVTPSELYQESVLYRVPSVDGSLNWFFKITREGLIWLAAVQPSGSSALDRQGLLADGFTLSVSDLLLSSGFEYIKNVESLAERKLISESMRERVLEASGISAAFPVYVSMRAVLDELDMIKQVRAHLTDIPGMFEQALAAEVQHNSGLGGASLRNALAKAEQKRAPPVAVPAQLVGVVPAAVPIAQPVVVVSDLTEPAGQTVVTSDSVTQTQATVPVVESPLDIARRLAREATGGTLTAAAGSQISVGAADPAALEPEVEVPVVRQRGPFATINWGQFVRSLIFAALTGATLASIGVAIWIYGWALPAQQNFQAKIGKPLPVSEAPYEFAAKDILPQKEVPKLQLAGTGILPGSIAGEAVLVSADQMKGPGEATSDEELLADAEQVQAITAELQKRINATAERLEPLLKARDAGEKVEDKIQLEISGFLQDLGLTPSGADYKLPNSTGASRAERQKALVLAGLLKKLTESSRTYEPQDTVTGPDTDALAAVRLGAVDWNAHSGIKNLALLAGGQKPVNALAGLFDGLEPDTQGVVGKPLNPNPLMADRERVTPPGEADPQPEAPASIKGQIVWGTIAKAAKGKTPFTVSAAGININYDDLIAPGKPNLLVVVDARDHQNEKFKTWFSAVTQRITEAG